jgi:hypothetical protein
MNGFTNTKRNQLKAKTPKSVQNWDYKQIILFRTVKIGNYHLLSQHKEGL